MRLAVDGQQSTVSGLWLAIGSWLSAVGGRRSVDGGRQSAVSSQPSAVGSWHLAVGGRRSAVGGWQSAGGRRQF